MEAQQDPPGIVQPLDDEPQPPAVLEWNTTAWVQRGADPRNRTQETIDLFIARNPHRAYQRILEWHIVPVDPNEPGLGNTFVCIVLQRLDEGVYLMPDEEERELVAI